MKPLSPKRSALVAALDVGTSKIACLIARLKPQRRRTCCAGAATPSRSSASATRSRAA
jgi:cell division ATPase FtsA